ncbi:hypothetical protein NDU88_004727 [Pleurodeles waltl]|uniref:Uncharacterized protein n=1 Tax=Pleurodeles waltl TaxID=8319 RepID=A0AAV7RLS1_PLEWA|nr:hypothetical protein NDU88_004727 [Pleurodeles waltl]
MVRRRLCTKKELPDPAYGRDRKATDEGEGSKQSRQSEERGNWLRPVEKENGIAGAHKRSQDPLDAATEQYCSCATKTLLVLIMTDYIQGGNAFDDHDNVNILFDGLFDPRTVELL